MEQLEEVEVGIETGYQPSVLRTEKRRKGESEGATVVAPGGHCRRPFLQRSFGVVEYRTCFLVPINGREDTRGPLYFRLEVLFEFIQYNVRFFLCQILCDLVNRI